MSATNSLLLHSVSRRRLIGVGATGSAALLGAALIGCSAQGGKPAAPAGTQGAAVPKASPAASGQPKSGGTFKFSVPGDIDSLDPYKATGGLQYWPTELTSSRLVSFASGHGAPASGKIIPDLAKTWEQPDPLTIVFHLDPAAKFDQRAPTNGRVVTSEDVVQSWKRYAAESTSRTELSNAASKNAPVTAVEAMDASTVRVKLAFPDSLVFPLLAANAAPFIQPVEGIAGKFAFTTDIRGSGPFILEKYQRSVGFTFKKNPGGWHGGAGFPYLDALNVSIIPEQAQSEVQFRSKNLHALAVSRANIPQFAKELKDTKVVLATPTAFGPYWGLSFTPDQPWNDVRARRALSMSLDRDKFTEVLFEPKAFAAVGVKLNPSWNNPMSAGFGDYWLDPKGKDLGPGAAYLQHNVAEAKKLLAAAGYTAQKPLEFDLIYAGVQHGRDYPTRVETWQAMAAEAGIKINGTVVEYTEYISKYFRGGAKFEGKKMKAAAHYPPGGGGTIDPLAWFTNHFSAQGASSAAGAFWPQLDEMIKKHRGVTEFAARKAGVQEIQRYLADQVIAIATGPSTESVDLVWKPLRGPGEVQGWGGDFPRTSNYHEYWLEEQI